MWSEGYGTVCVCVCVCVISLHEDLQFTDIKIRIVASAFSIIAIYSDNYCISLCPADDWVLPNQKRRVSSRRTRST